MLQRRTALAGVMALAAAKVFSQGVPDFPRRPIKLIAPFAAGGTSDIMSRTLAKELQGELGQPVVVDNQVGAGGTIGLTNVARSPADGYTIGMGGVGSLVHSAGVYAKTIRFDVRKDFTPLGLLGTAPVVVAASPALGITDIKGLIEKAQREKGTIAYGSAGVGGALHLAAEMLQRKAGIELRHIPYRGAAPALNDLLAGQISLAFLDVTTLLPYKDSDKLHLLAAASRERVKAMPKVPTFIEQGFADLVVEVWYGLVGPNNLPSDVASKLAAATEKAVTQPDYAKALARLGMQAMEPGRQAMARLIEEEYAYWLPLIREAHISAE